MAAMPQVNPKMNGHSNTYKVGMPTHFLRNPGERVDVERTAQKAANANGLDQAILRPLEPGEHSILRMDDQEWMLDQIIHPDLRRRFAGLPTDHMPWERP